MQSYEELKDQLEKLMSAFTTQTIQKPAFLLIGNFNI